MIKIEPTDYWTRYTGTREELIDAGVATADMFAELPKRVKDYYPPDYELTGRWETRRIRGGRFAVMKWHERAPRTKCTYQDPEELRAWATKMAAFGFGMIYQIWEARDRGAGGDREIPLHRLSDADITKLREIQTEAVEVIRKAEIIPTGHGAPVRQLRCVN